MYMYRYMKYMGKRPHNVPLCGIYGQNMVAHVAVVMEVIVHNRVYMSRSNSDCTLISSDSLLLNKVCVNETLSNVT